MLLVTFIIGSLALLAYSSWPQNDYRHYYFMDDYLALQARAMADNAEYLFFVGSLIPVAEWLFGLKETNKEPKEQLGCKMLYQATLIEPYNMLYKWSYMDYYGDPQSKQLAQDILSDQVVVSYLRRQGYAGEYMLDILGVASTWVDD